MKVPILAVGLTALFASVASAQYRPPIRPPAPTPAVRPAPVAPRPNVPPAVNGNSGASNRPQHVYGIVRSDTATGQTRFQKFGVSGGETRGSGATGRNMLAPTRDYSNRALTQTRQLNAEAARTGERATYHTRILERIPAQPAGQTPARAVALAAEKRLVTQARVKSDAAVPKNVLPQPYGFSRLQKK